MSAAFTLGPWHVGGQHKCTVYDKFSQRLANSFEGVMSTHRSDAECQANALLIAAAPDLLNELINLTARFKAAIVQAGTDEEFAEQAVASARAAIAKALPVTTKDAEVRNG